LIFPGEKNRTAKKAQKHKNHFNPKMWSNELVNRENEMNKKIEYVDCAGQYIDMLGGDF